MLKNTQKPTVVSEDQRRANSRAKQRLERWRKQYSAISQAIRSTKAERRKTGSLAFDYQLQMQLIALRNAAAIMMEDREDLGEVLRSTSYVYASREEVTAA